MKGKHEMSQIEGDILDLMKLVITQCSFFFNCWNKKFKHCEIVIDNEDFELISKFKRICIISD